MMHIINVSHCCTISDIVSIFSIVAIIKYDVIVCNICTHAQQRFLTVTRAKWWSLYAGRNPKTSQLYSSHGYSAIQTRLPWMM